jgi:hypothetical protein
MVFTNRDKTDSDLSTISKQVHELCLDRTAKGRLVDVSDGASMFPVFLSNLEHD